MPEYQQIVEWFRTMGCTLDRAKYLALVFTTGGEIIEISDFFKVLPLFGNVEDLAKLRANPSKEGLLTLLRQKSESKQSSTDDFQTM